MARDDSSGYARNQLIALVAVLTFGLTALVAVLGGGTLVPVIFVLGFFILIPLIALLGEDFPLVENKEKTPQPATQQDPIETLRDRFARGEIDQAEFERRLEYIVETEDIDFDVGERLGHIGTNRQRESPSRQRESQSRELERE